MLKEIDIRTPVCYIKATKQIHHRQKKGASTMGQTDKQFGGFLRMLIARIKSVIAEADPEKRMAMLQEILKDLQTTLED